ncbi:unnamed protein product, partial [Nesidiocoris tenuis]
MIYEQYNKVRRHRFLQDGQRSASFGSLVQNWCGQGFVRRAEIDARIGRSPET